MHIYIYVCVCARVGACGCMRRWTYLHIVCEEGERVLVFKCQNRWCLGLLGIPARRSWTRCRRAKLFSLAHASSDGRSGCADSSTYQSSKACAQERSLGPFTMRPWYLGSSDVAHQRKRSCVSPALVLIMCCSGSPNIPGARVSTSLGVLPFAFSDLYHAFNSMLKRLIAIPNRMSLGGPWLTNTSERRSLQIHLSRVGQSSSCQC